MRRQISVTVKGMDRLLRAMNRAPSVIQSSANEAIRESIYAIQRGTTPLTPYKTGALRRSLGLGISFGHLYGRISPTVEYAYYVHEGTRYMVGRPYLEQGWDASKAEVEKIFNDTYVEAMTKITR